DVLTTTTTTAAVLDIACDGAAEDGPDHGPYLLVALPVAHGVADGTTNYRAENVRRGGVVVTAHVALTDHFLVPAFTGWRAGLHHPVHGCAGEYGGFLVLRAAGLGSAGQGKGAGQQDETGEPGALFHLHGKILLPVI